MRMPYGPRLGLAVALALGFCSSSHADWTVSLVASDPLLRTATGVYAAGSDLYVSVYNLNAGYIARVPMGGGTVSTLYNSWGSSGGRTPAGITGIGSNLYWVDANSGPGSGTQILQAPLGGGGPVVPIYSQGSPIYDGSQITTDGTRLFVADGVGGNVFGLNPDGTNFVEIGGSRYSGGFANEHIVAITQNNGTLYVADGGKSGVISPQILSVPASGGVYQTLASRFAYPETWFGMTTDGTQLFFSDSTSRGIYSLPFTGGTPTLLVSDPRFEALRSLTYFDNSLYVVDAGNGGVGSMWKVSQAVPEPSSFGLAAVGCVTAVAFALNRRR